MSDGSGQAIYIVDTSALMDWHDRYYPSDAFPTLVKLVDDLIQQWRMESVELVHDEVKKMGSTTLQAWAKRRANIFDPTKNHLTQALAVEGQFPALKDSNAQFDEADAYVIALAQIRRAIVVTGRNAGCDKAQAASVDVHSVCSALGMASISNLGMLRREGWKL